MTTLSPERRIQRVRHEIRRRDVSVAWIDRPSPHFASIVFAGDSLADFQSLSFDDHVKFIFDDEQGHTLMRDYTPRHFDRHARELTIEFALHANGPAARWARLATVGQRAVIAGPKGSMIVPADYDWHLLAGDASALPAIHRRLDELGPATPVIVLAHLGDEADRMEWSTRSQTDVLWARTESEWLDLLRNAPWPEGDGFVWCAAEASAIARARDILLIERRHPRESLRAAAYWKRGASGFHETL